MVLQDTLFESELFGYEQGAFTGAHDEKPGRVEFADDGALFLDEIADLCLVAQASCFGCWRTGVAKDLEDVGASR